MDYETVSFDEIKLILDDRSNEIPIIRAAAKKRNEKKVESRGATLLKRIKGTSAEEPET